MLAMLFLAALTCGDLCSPQAAFWYRELLVEGGYGRLPRERAAFLIRESDGTLTLVPWPEGGYRHATWRGAIPARAVAVLHTHPYREPNPSPRDRAEARRLALPVGVITPAGVRFAWP
jgi:proteasome lid subunit RPN8/RPN11